MPAEEIFYTMATQRLDAQMQRIDGLDAKATTAFAFSSSILAFFGAFVSLSTIPTGSIVRPRFIGLIVAAIVVYVALLVCLYRAYRINSRLSFRPDLATLEAYCRTYSLNAMQVWVGQECLASINANEPGIGRKARWLQVALILVPIESILLLCAALVDLLAK